MRNAMYRQKIKELQNMIEEDGCQESLNAFIIALREAADTYSDLGLKELAIETANMADRLIQIQKGCSII